MNTVGKVVVLSGAGISAESGLKTFRGGDGLWENHRIEDVASPLGWAKDQAKVLRFYDERRIQVLEATPNAAHIALAQLEKRRDVSIITQNIDDLHERAGSSNVLHLHGEILKARSTMDESIVVPVEGSTIPLGAKCPLGSQLRPHIVWFGEPVPLLEEAAEIISAATVLIIVGTSLNVYPAAGLIHAAGSDCAVYAVNPNDIPVGSTVTHLKEKASTGIPILASKILSKWP